jgi:peptide/nickel transport system permease protein
VPHTDGARKQDRHCGWTVPEFQFGATGVTNYLIQRLLLLLPTFLGVSLLVFSAVRIIPGGPESVYCAAGCTERDAAEIRHALGLEGPVLAQYRDWVGKVLVGDFGRSYQSHIPVNQEMARRLPVTLELSLLALAIAFCTSIPLGVAAAARRGAAFDNTIRLIAVAFLCAPSFWIATLVIAYAGAWFNWAPPLVYRAPWDSLGDNLQSLGIPALILAGATFGVIVRLTRTQFIDVLQQDYMRVARAKGLSPLVVIVRHALRNGLLPILTYIGAQVPLLIGGSVVVEAIFQVPGMGQYLVGAIAMRDFPVIQGINLVVAAAVLLANFVVDLSYTLLDPRLRVGGPTPRLAMP